MFLSPALVTLVRYDTLTEVAASVKLWLMQLAAMAKDGP